MKKFCVLLLVLALLSVNVPVFAEPSGKLVVYSAANNEEYNMIMDPFKAKYPNIEIEVVEGGSGELKTRLVGELQNPQADVMFGGLTQADARAYAQLWEEYISPEDAYELELLSLQ